MSQYTGSYETDACAGNKCAPMFSASSSLTQGQQFASLTKDFHGGKRKTNSRRFKNARLNRMKASRKNAPRKGSRKVSLKGGKGSCYMKGGKGSYYMNGGSAEYPNSFQDLLPQNLHGAAQITGQDNAFAELPKFIGSYGSMTGGRRTRKMRGGVAPVDAPGMILSKAEEGPAFLNPQWYTENQVIPSFKGPENAFAAQQYATQFAYKQNAGSRKRKVKKAKVTRKKAVKATKPWYVLF